MNVGWPNVSEICSKATWPDIPAECLTRVVDGQSAPGMPIHAFTYARKSR